MIYYVSHKASRLSSLMWILALEALYFCISQPSVVFAAYWLLPHIKVSPITHKGCSESVESASSIDQHCTAPPQKKKKKVFSRVPLFWGLHVQLEIFGIKYLNVDSANARTIGYSGQIILMDHDIVKAPVRPPVRRVLYLGFSAQSVGGPEKGWLAFQPYYDEILARTKGDFLKWGWLGDVLSRDGWI